MTTLRFDEVIHAAVQVIRGRTGNGPCAVTLVRDVAGQVTAVVESTPLEDSELEELATALDARLGRFSPGPQRVLLRRSDLIDEQDVLQSPDRVRLPDYDDVWLVDRLLTNQDWLRKAPAEMVLPLRVATAFSLKGGVGRSTAVAVLAWHLAREGQRVVAIDLDLEAPGLGSLLLDDLPDYGIVDWLVDDLLERPSQEVLDDCLALSPVTKDTEGVIQVLPAFGSKTREYVAKVGRVYLPGLETSGDEIGLADRIRHLLEALARRDDPPTVALLDSRAGLHDIAAAAVTQLGAEVFIFARDEPQSWRAYRLLFEHLSKSKAIRFGMPDDDLRWRLKMVAAQIGKPESATLSWVDRSYDAWSALYDDEARSSDSDFVAQTFVRDESSAPHYPLALYFDEGLRGMGLADPSQRPHWLAVEPAFREFLAGATARLRVVGRTGAGGNARGA